MNLYTMIQRYSFILARILTWVVPGTISDTRPDYDHLWKDVITDLFEEFLLFFFPELYEHVDFTVPPEFLEQELHSIIPESQSTKRYSDKLVKLKLKNGEEQWVLVHVEVQGDYKKDFPKRMFQYFYRVMDLYDQYIYALVIFTSHNTSPKMNAFHYNFFGTTIDYFYNTYRIAIQSETELLKSNNPFALAVLAGLYAIKSKKNPHLKYKFKRQLMRLLLQDKMKEKEVKREYIQKLFIFIDHLLRLPEKSDDKLNPEIKSLVEREDFGMGLSFEDTSFAKFIRKEAMEEGIEKGEKQKATAIAVKLLKKGFTVEEVAEDTELSVEEVNKVKETMER
ncbi:Rpn family recombination-promoting nuclease/putative transposase [Niallia oryzisoli]|uniref:Rpn family recombination-promoting nuclease/putative transposase n=1 Tax=Niallia oryzisoli TaxID=1737571 RepID=UPI0037357847